MAVPAPTDLCNMALQKLGCNKIASLKPPDNSPNARACFRVYWRILDMLLRDHAWTFAIQRFQLSASTKAPLFGYAFAYPLPAGWRKVVPITTNESSYWGSNPTSTGSFLTRQYSIEADSILTNITAPLNVRLVVYIDDTSKFDSLFDEVFATMMAIEMCEELTQSNTKKQVLEQEFKELIERAKFANAIENPSQKSERDTYETVRR